MDILRVLNTNVSTQSEFFDKQSQRIDDTWFIQARLCKIQGLFKDYKFMKHTEFYFIISLPLLNEIV